MEGLTRRQLLIGAVALRKEPRIAIIGAGLSGLVCAHKLRQQGYTAEVYEASARSGGQIDPASDADFVAKHHYFARALCAELRVRLAPVTLNLGDVPAALRDAIKNTDDVPDRLAVSSLNSALANDLCPVITGLDAAECSLAYFFARTTLSEARTVQDLLGYHFRFRAFTLIEKMAVPVKYATRVAPEELKHDAVVVAHAGTLARGTLKKSSRKPGSKEGIGQGEVSFGDVTIVGGRKTRDKAGAAWRAGEHHDVGNVEGRVVRCGEHAAETAFGTYEGAIESGERAAADVIKICSRAR